MLFKVLYGGVLLLATTTIIHINAQAFWHSELSTPDHYYKTSNWLAPSPFASPTAGRASAGRSLYQLLPINSEARSLNDAIRNAFVAENDLSGLNSLSSAELNDNGAYNWHKYFNVPSSAVDVYQAKRSRNEMLANELSHDEARS